MAKGKRDGVDKPSAVEPKQLELPFIGEIETPFKKYIKGTFNNDDVKELQLENQKLRSQLNEMSEEANALERDLEYAVYENGFLNEAIDEATRQLYFMWDRTRAYMNPPHGETKEETRRKFARGDNEVTQVILEIIYYLHAKNGKDCIQIPDQNRQENMKSLWGSYASWLLDALQKHKAKFESKKEETLNASF